jgi:hypothetical protein
MFLLFQYGEQIPLSIWSFNLETVNDSFHDKPKSQANLIYHLIKGLSDRLGGAPMTETGNPEPSVKRQRLC